MPVNDLISIKSVDLYIGSDTAYICYCRFHASSQGLAFNVRLYDISIVYVLYIFSLSHVTFNISTIVKIIYQSKEALEQPTRLGTLPTLIVEFFLLVVYTDIHVIMIKY